MRLLAVVKNPASIVRDLAAVGELTGAPGRSATTRRLIRSRKSRGELEAGNALIAGHDRIAVDALGRRC